MIELTIPGRGVIKLHHLVCDVNGTLALDGVLHDGVARLFNGLRDRLTIHLLTADTHGRQVLIDQQLNLISTRIDRGHEAEQKRAYIEGLGAETVAAIGQGANDAAMLKSAAIGIAIFSQEGIATEALLAADLIVPDISAALELFDKPLRIVATLRK